MADLLLPAANLIALTVPVVKAPQQRYIDYSKIVLRLGQPAPVRSTTPEVVDAIQQLITIIEELRSPGSGWSADVPQTAEALMPYVSEEANDVLDALQNQKSAIHLEVLPETSLFGQQVGQTYVVLQDLFPWILWGIARSACDVMQLLEGVVAKTFQAEQGWQYGILRLVALLVIESSESSSEELQIDLVTNQLAHSLLPADTLIQSDECSLFEQPALASTWMEQLTEQAQLATPAIRSLLAGMITDLLMPHHDWRSTQVKLQLRFEFIPAVEDGEGADDRVFFEPEVHLDDIIATSTRQSDHVMPLITFTNEAWCDCYRNLVRQQQLNLHIPQLPIVQAIQAGTSEFVIDPLMTQLIEEVCALAETLHCSLALANDSSVHQDVRLDGLMTQLLWMINRSSYDVMQLLSGVPATALKPGFDWQMGTLRLLAYLRLQTPEGDRHFDLATGQLIEPMMLCLPERAMIHGVDQHWCHQPGTVNELKAKVKQQISQATPELLCFFDAIDVDVLHSNEQRQSGFIHLVVDFEFTPLE